MKTFMLKSIVLPVAAGLLLLSSAVHSAVLLDKIVATVNDEVITWSELMSVIAMEGNQYLRGVSEEERNRRIAELERPFLNNLIEMKLQLQEAGRMGLGVTDAEIDAAVADIKKKFNLSDEAFEESLRAERLSMKEYRERLRDQILLQKVVNFAVRAKVVVTDEDVEGYLKEHAGEYAGKMKMRIRQIFFKTPESEEERRNLMEKAEQIYKRIMDGEDFSKLARLYSEGPERDFGGDLGYVSPGAIRKEIEETALSLGVGKVSRPFWSPAGLHIIRLEERLETGDSAKTKDNVRKMLTQKKFEEGYHEWISRLREDANIEMKLND